MVNHAPQTESCLNNRMRLITAQGIIRLTAPVNANDVGARYRRIQDEAHDLFQFAWREVVGDLAENYQIELLLRPCLGNGSVFDTYVRKLLRSSHRLPQRRWYDVRAQKVIASVGEFFGQTPDRTAGLISGAVVRGGASWLWSGRTCAVRNPLMRSPRDQDHPYTCPRNRFDWWRSFVRSAESQDFERTRQRPKYRRRQRMVGVIEAQSYADLLGECTERSLLGGGGPGRLPWVTFGPKGRARRAKSKAHTAYSARLRSVEIAARRT